MALVEANLARRTTRQPMTMGVAPAATKHVQPANQWKGLVGSTRVNSQPRLLRLEKYESVRKLKIAP
ncbi:hypothetical protein D6779_01835 [Candidatus Parcubacteria bacterium]|nr:MAG: hypothetical protein D6779_01835 [Candidatus Parcubacteria bacterium]